MYDYNEQKHSNQDLANEQTDSNIFEEEIWPHLDENEEDTELF